MNVPELALTESPAPTVNKLAVGSVLLKIELEDALAAVVSNTK
jgi:hypothetical protein